MAGAISGNQIRAARGLIGLSQVELAALAGLNRNTVQDIERRDALPPRSGAKVAKALGVRGVALIPGGVRWIAAAGSPAMGGAR